MSEIMKRLGFIEQLRPYVADDAALSRMRVDLHDLIEASEWLLSEVKKRETGLMTPEELESFLIDLDVHYILHVSFHIKSLKSEINASLEKFPEN
ncbi:hypothetical protein U1769_07065 [Sphingomonas sp. ZT3P38]